MQDQLKQKYLQLRLDRNGGRIDEQTFTNEVAQLRYQDNSGNWWQIEPQTGQWLIWNGSAWAAPTPSQKLAKAVDKVPAPGAAPAKQAKQHYAHHQSQQHGQQQSQSQSQQRQKYADNRGTAPEVFSPADLQGSVNIDFKGLLRQIVKNTFTRYRIMIIVGVTAFLLHTFLIAVANDGFDKDSRVSSMFARLTAYNSTIFSGRLPWYVDYTIGDFKVGSNIAIIGNQFNATFGWLLGGAVLLSAWRGFRANGLFGGLRRFFTLPRQIAAACCPHLGLNLAAIFFGALFARQLSDMMPHQAQNMSSFLSLGLIGSIIPLALGGYAARLGIYLANTLKIPGLRQISYAGLAQLAFLGVSAGMFSKSCWQYGPTAGWGLALYASYLVITKTNQAMPVSPRLNSFFTLIALTGALIALSEETVFAHDKGWWENVNPNDPLTKQITSWINAGGSKELMQAGIPPAIGAAIGAGAVDAATTTTTYVLQVSSYSITVSPEQPENLLVAVWKSENGGPLVLAGDANIAISSSGSTWLTMSNTSGSCRINCFVGQSASSMSDATVQEPATLYITAIGGGQSCSATVAVTPGGLPAYILEVF